MYLILPTSTNLTEVSAAMSSLIDQCIYVSTYTYSALRYELTASDIAKIDFSEVEFDKVGVYAAYFDLKIDKSNEIPAWKGEYRVVIPILILPRDIINNVEEETPDGIKAYLDSQQIEYKSYTPENEYLTYAGYLSELIVYDNYVAIVKAYYDDEILGEYEITIMPYAEIDGTAIIEVFDYYGGLFKTHFYYRLDDENSVFARAEINGDVAANYIYAGSWPNPGFKLVEYDNGLADYYIEDEGIYHYVATMDIRHHDNVIELFGTECEIREQIDSNTYMIEFVYYGLF